MGNGKSKNSGQKRLEEEVEEQPRTSESLKRNPDLPAPKVLSQTSDETVTDDGQSPYSFQSGKRGLGPETRALSTETPIHPMEVDLANELPPLPNPTQAGQRTQSPMPDNLPIQPRTVTDAERSAGSDSGGGRGKQQRKGSRLAQRDNVLEDTPPKPTMHQRTISRMHYNDEGDLTPVDEQNFMFMEAMDDESAWMACKIMEHIGGSLDAHKKKMSVATNQTLMSVTERSANVFDAIIQKTLGDIQRSKKLFMERKNTMILEFNADFKQSQRGLTVGDWVDVQDDLGDWQVGKIQSIDSVMETARVSYAKTREDVEAKGKTCLLKTVKFAMVVRCHDDLQDENGGDIFSLIDKFMSQCKELKPGEEYTWKDVKVVDIPLADEILEVLNQVRQHPKEFAEFIKSMLKLFRADEQGGIIAHTSGALIRTHEGRHAYDETIELLENMEPVPPLKLANGLSKAADDHAFDGEEKGVRGHMGSDGSNPAERAERYGDWYGNFGNCVGYPRRYYNAHDIVRMLIVDDGNKKRSQRRNILSKDFKFIGVSIRPHSAEKIDRICVISFVSSYRQTKDIQPNRPTSMASHRQPSRASSARSRMMGSRGAAFET